MPLQSPSPGRCNEIKVFTIFLFEKADGHILLTRELGQRENIPLLGVKFSRFPPNITL